MIEDSPDNCGESLQAATAIACTLFIEQACRTERKFANTETEFQHVTYFNDSSNYGGRKQNLYILTWISTAKTKSPHADVASRRPRQLARGQASVRASTQGLRDVLACAGGVRAACVICVHTSPSATSIRACIRSAIHHLPFPTFNTLSYRSRNNQIRLYVYTSPSAIHHLPFPTLHGIRA